jgi:phosphoglycerol transferase MdoB-like AlkP superfamily enzyme
MSDASIADASLSSDYTSRRDKMGGEIDKYAALVASASGKDAGSESLTRFLGYFNQYVRPVVTILLGVLLVVRGTLLIVNIIKASDEPSVRKDNIKHLVTLFVSVFVVIVLIWVTPEFIDIMKDLINGDL